MKSKEVQIRFGLLVLLLGSFVWGFRDLIFVHLPGAFTYSSNDMAFFWLVPIFSAFVLVLERREFRASWGEPSIVCLLLAFPFLFLGFIGTRGLQMRLQLLALAGLIPSVTGALLGWKAAKRILFPSLFLLFCVPLTNYLDVIGIHLRSLTIAIVREVLAEFDVDVMWEKTSMVFGAEAFRINLAELGGRFRSFFAVMAVTVGYAYLSQPTWLRRSVLFALAVPFAVVGNVVRLLMVCFLGVCVSNIHGLYLYEKYRLGGLVVTLVAFPLLVLSSVLINKFAGKGVRAVGLKDGCGVVNGCVPDPSPIRKRLMPILCLIVVLPLMYFQSDIPELTVCDAPSVSLPELSGFTSEVRLDGKLDVKFLPADTRVEKRQYRTATGDWFIVSLVFGGKTRGSTHQPEVCLTAQKHVMSDSMTVDAGGRSWRIIKLDEGVGNPPLGFAYTFFNQDGFRTSSHVFRIFKDVWDRALHGRIDRWVMVTLYSSCYDTLKLREFLSKLGPSLK